MMVLVWGSGCESLVVCVGVWCAVRCAVCRVLSAVCSLQSGSLQSAVWCVVCDAWSAQCAVCGLRSVRSGVCGLGVGVGVCVWARACAWVWAWAWVWQWA